MSKAEPRCPRLRLDVTYISRWSQGNHQGNWKIPQISASFSGQRAAIASSPYSRFIQVHDIDLLSALGLDTNILQFVQFAFGLLTNAQRIHLSGPSPSSEEQPVEGIHARLLDFKTLLQGRPHSYNADEAVFQSSRYSVALAELVEE
jgi:hypothetical protein